MWNKIWRYTLYTLVWILIVGYVIYSAMGVRQSRQSQMMERVEIIISDSAMHGNLITTHMVERWIKSSGVEIVGCPLAEIPIYEIEEYILRNGFVERVKIYPTHSGAMKVELSQRRAVMRLLVTGYNGYATGGGYIFEAPSYASIYIPIVTGSYRPPFPPSYRGAIDKFIESESRRLLNKIDEIEREKYPLYEREQQNLEDMRELRKMFIKQGWIESDEKFEERVLKLRIKKAELRKLYRYRSEVISNEIAKISDKQDRVRTEEKKLKKRCEDFTKLINFVHIVENDKFWRSEVVQIIASEGSNGELRINLSVRSGEFEIVFGSLRSDDSENSEGVEQRLDKLLRFYKDGLRRVGWNSYRSINVEYKGQVVCK